MADPMHLKLGMKWALFPSIKNISLGIFFHKFVSLHL